MKNFTRTVTNKLIRSVQCVFALVMISLSGYSQNVAINGTLAPANASAGLDVDFPAKGFLIPRVALLDINNFAPLTSHVAGMVLFNTATVASVTPGIYFNDGTKWIPGSKQGNATGEMQYWDGTTWAAVPGGIAGQYFTVGVGGIPLWSGSVSGYATLSTNQTTSVTATTASSGGNITNNGGTAITARGVCWSTSPSPTIALITKTSNGTGNGSFTSSITGLVTGTTYYVRAYATNSLGTVYGNEVIFKTN
jgi:hypothetical protein